MALHAEVLGPTYQGELEIRQLADFGPEAGNGGPEGRAS
jgi:hypothetical protein